MEYPVDTQDAQDKISIGRLTQGLVSNQGYQKLLKPFLADLLKKADDKCHDYKIRADRGKDAVVEYCTIKVIMDFISENIENMEHAIEYCRENNINI